MNQEERIEEQMDRYTRGELTEKEQLAFLAELEQYPELREELKIRSHLAKGIDSYVNRDIKSRLQSIQKEVNTEQSAVLRPIRSIYKMVAAAAAILLLLSVSFWYLQSGTTSTEQLYAAYYQAYPDLFSVRNDANNPQLTEAKDLYLQKNYRAALPYFEQLLAANPSDSKLLLATGICQLETGATQAALGNFQSLIQLNDIYLGDQAVWYSALAQVKLNNLALAKPLLQQLTSKKDSDHYQEAKDLLNSLN